MDIMAVIDMKNENALISMALISQNANNPYLVFCEYIKYCIFTDTENKMSITNIQESVNREFGIILPYNIILKCLSLLADKGYIEVTECQVKRIGIVNTETFEHERSTYKTIENRLIESLIDYVAKYNQIWDYNYARKHRI